MRTRVPGATASARARVERVQQRRCRRRRAARAPTRTGGRAGACAAARRPRPSARHDARRADLDEVVDGVAGVGVVLERRARAPGPPAVRLPRTRWSRRPVRKAPTTGRRCGGTGSSSVQVDSPEVTGAVEHILRCSRHRPVWPAVQRSVAGPARTCSTAGMAFNIADLIEHTVDAVPDRTALICGDRAGDLRRARGAGQPARPPPRRAAASASGDHVAHLRVQQPRVRRDDAGRLQAAGGPDQRQLPLRRGRAASTCSTTPTSSRSSYQAAVRAADRGGARPAAAAAPPRRDRRRQRHRPRRRRRGRRTRRRSPARRPSATSARATDDDIYILYTGGTTGMPEGRRCGATRTCCACSAAASTSSPASGSRTSTSCRATAEEAEPARRPRARAAHARRRAVGHARRPVQGHHQRAAAEVRPARGVGGGRASTASPRSRITGDAMARPLIEALAGARPTTRRRSSPIASHRRGVLAGREGRSCFELLPEPVHQRGRRLRRRAGFNGMRLVEKGATVNAGGLINVAHGSRHDRDRRRQPAGAARARSAGWRAAATCPLGYYKDPEKTAATFVEVDGKRYSVPGDFARLELDGTHDAARPRLAVHQLGRREDLPRGGRGRAQGPPEGVRRARGRRAPTSAGASGSPPSCSRARAQAPTLDELAEHCRTTSPATRCRAQLHLVDEMPRQPSGKPDYPWAKAIAERARGGHA